MIDKKKRSAGDQPERSESKQKTTDIIADTAPENKGETTKKDYKSRVWWCVVYPESAPPNWVELAKETFLEGFISPLHDRDLLPDGSKKKEHYHVPLMWSGPTTYSRAKEVMATFGGIIQPKVVGSLRGVARYLCHLDNPDKAQYDVEDVICLNGADYEAIIESAGDKYIILEEMQDFCVKYEIISFHQLNAYAKKHRPSDWYRCLCDNGAYVMREFLKSLKWEKETYGHISTIEEIETHIADVDAGRIGVDPDTGELLEAI